jgi:hypothetical protein
VATSGQTCGNCGEPLTPRGGLPPRFCPRCGCRLPSRPLPPLGRLPATSGGVSTPAIVSLVLGIIGLPTPMGCFPFGLAAILLGVYARGQIESSHGGLRGYGIATAGVVLGAISSALWLGVCARVL